MDAQIETLQEAIVTMVRMLKIVEPEVETAHGQLKLAATDIHTMRFVAANPGCPSVRIAAFLGVGPTTMSSALKRLEERSVLCRNRTETNRPIVLAELTDEGEATFDAILSEERMISTAML
ncbi:MarR family winged helix-turn-helix transcriptional regulator [Cognatiyoonia sp. IB215446]|uniref:MarR family winged helix-turn-helix transcriptional regulator n=1 Tax=Cognatiyoonia sp. IB215446 TaxID=3097355 RepID=UPI002A0DA059|nr:MarR family winged helix-turn-helix transcriptional regulator [Cognatiyoonia sp. IB215446]MDX8349111.1 MarR family winged helix-turn-helix transcriptional regulator [Cognatiyoonia sp. IB215446]